MMIDGNFFKSLADIEIYQKIPEHKDVVILYSDTKHYQRAIRIIENHKHKQFKLITHNGDESVTNCYVPDNLIAWYAQNLEFSHRKVFPIPIGFENEHWHPHKRQIINEAKKAPRKITRKLKALSQFNPVTYPEERLKLIESIKSGSVFSDSYYCLNGNDFDKYVENLQSYAFCLCPRGNGIDTHRLWESIYLGCIPIVKKHITHIFDKQLPIVFVDSWNEVTEDFLKKKYEAINLDLFQSKILTENYWRKKIST